VRLIDTAGIRAHAGRLEAAGIERSERALEAARIALVVVDGSVALDDAAAGILARTRSHRRVVLFNKRDAGTAGYDARPDAEGEALCISLFDPHDLDRVRAALRDTIGIDAPDLERPHLSTVRQADCVLAAARSLANAERTLLRANRSIWSLQTYWKQLLRSVISVGIARPRRSSTASSLASASASERKARITHDHTAWYATVKGSVRARLPLIAKTAFATAGAIGITPSSPIPVGAAAFSIRST